MKKLYYILLILFSSILLSEEVEIIVQSSPFTIDTIEPEIEIFSPSHGDFFGPEDVIIVTWSASDSSPAPSPMTLNVSPHLDDPYVELASGFPNIGNLELNVPNFINTIFASVRLDIRDYYGNVSSAYTDGYFTIGNPNQNIYDIVNESISIQSTSASFEIDTKAPVVSWIFPNESTSFNPLQGQVVRWSAVDETMPNNPIDLLFIDGGTNYSLADDIINNGQKFIHLPDIETSLGYFKVNATDNYGNVGYDLSDEYMSIGSEENNQLEDESVTIEIESEPFEIDTKLPIFSLINENDYFYPNGGELLTDYNNINFNWNASDDSFENGEVEVSLAYLLGGWYTSLGTFEASNPYSATADFSINGLVENTIWARLIYTAIDDYGNSNSQYSDDYFTLGSSDGNISADLLDEDDIEMFVSWTWENQKHRIKISPRALENMEIGNQIVIVGENSIQSADCATPLGITNLGLTEIEPTSVDEVNTADRIVINQGVNHCDYGGGALPGYTVGDSIRIKIVETDTSYFLRPSDYTGSLVFNNGVTIIKEFDSSPYQIDRYNDNEILVENSREWDQFSVYGKVTNHQGSSRACDGDGICDSSELLDSYTNENDCTSNAGQWNGLLCYYDYNGDGEYSPDEIDENIADCYSDCCAQSGAGENEGWCFVETINSEEYTHSLVQNNYLPVNTSSATVNYRVWLLDNQSNEIYKTVDTEDYEIQIGTDDIPDYINHLGQGWNWISLNIEDLGNMSLNNIFSNSELTNNDYIKSQINNSTYYSSGNMWYPDWQMDIKSLYLINTNEEFSILYDGTYNNLSEVEIPIASGWNWIGYTPNISLNIDTALSLFDANNQDYIKGQTVSSIYYSAGDGGMWYPDINLQPNQGYMLQCLTEESFFYPEIESNFNNNALTSRLFNEPNFNYRQYQYNASITIELDMPHVDITENDIIEVFLNNEQRGMAIADICPLNNKILFNLMLYSNNEMDKGLNFIYYNMETGKEYYIREKIDFEKDTIIGNAYDPILLTDVAIPYKNELMAPYPNPFNPITTINFSLIEDYNNISIKAYDIRGRLVENLYSGFMSYGYHSIIWDASNFSSGIYFINLVTDNNSFSKKITLLK
jgi:hypothetical protein